MADRTIRVGLRDGTFADMPEGEAIAKWASGEAGLPPDVKVPVVGKDGTIQSLSQSEADVYLKTTGVSLASPTVAREKRVAGSEVWEGAGAKALTAAHGLIRGATVGLIDHTIPDEDKEALRMAREANPALAIGSEIVGTIPTLLVPGGGVAGGVTRTAARGAQAIGTTGRLANMGAHALGASVEAAAYGMSMKAADLALENKEITSESLLAAGGFSMLIGAPLGLAAGAFGKIAPRAAAPSASMVEDAAIFMRGKKKLPGVVGKIEADTEAAAKAAYTYAEAPAMGREAIPSVIAKKDALRREILNVSEESEKYAATVRRVDDSELAKTIEKAREMETEAASLRAEATAAAEAGNEAKSFMLLEKAGKVESDAKGLTKSLFEMNNDAAAAVEAKADRLFAEAKTGVPPRQAKVKISLDGSEVTDIAPAPAAKALREIESGNSLRIKDGRHEFVVKNTDGLYSCSCNGWKFQKKPNHLRTCKHIRGIRGPEAEVERLRLAEEAGAPPSGGSRILRERAKYQTLDEQIRNARDGIEAAHGDARAEMALRDHALRIRERVALDGFDEYNAVREAIKDAERMNDEVSIKTLREVLDEMPPPEVNVPAPDTKALREQIDESLDMFQGDFGVMNTKTKEWRALLDEAETAAMHGDPSKMVSVREKILKEIDELPEHVEVDKVAEAAGRGGPAKPEGSAFRFPGEDLDLGNGVVIPRENVRSPDFFEPQPPPFEGTMSEAVLGKIKGALGRPVGNAPSLDAALYSMSLEKMVAGANPELVHTIKALSKVGDKEGWDTVAKMWRMFYEEIPGKLKTTRPTNRAMVAQAETIERDAAREISRELALVDDHLPYDARPSFREIDNLVDQRRSMLLQHGATELEVAALDKAAKNLRNAVGERIARGGLTQADKAAGITQKSGRALKKANDKFDMKKFLRGGGNESAIQPKPSMTDLYAAKQRAEEALVSAGVPRERWASFESGSPPGAGLTFDQVAKLEWHHAISTLSDFTLTKADDVAALARPYDKIKHAMRRRTAAAWIGESASNRLSRELGEATNLNVNAGAFYQIAVSTGLGIATGTAAVTVPLSAASLAVSSAMRKASHSGMVDRFLGNTFYSARKLVQRGAGAEEAITHVLGKQNLATVAAARGTTMDVQSRMKLEVAKTVARTFGKGAKALAVRAVTADEINEAKTSVNMIQFLRDNPKTAQGVAYDSTLSLRLASPELADATQQKALAILAFLESKLPPQPARGPFQGPPQDLADSMSRSALQQWNSYVRVLNDPTRLLVDLRENSLTIETVEAFKVGYPAMFEEVKSNLQRELLRENKPVPYQKRMQYSMLFGLDEPTLSTNFVGYLQGMWGVQEKKPGAKPSGPTSDNRNFMMTYAKSMETPTAAVTGPKPPRF